VPYITIHLFVNGWTTFAWGLVAGWISVGLLLCLTAQRRTK